MKRQRGRNRNNRSNNSHNNNNNSNRSMESNGPDTKVRGTAANIYEKYTTLARDAKTSGHRVKAENYLQHAEHYLRLVNMQEAAKQEAREKAEAERAARGESPNNNNDDDENRRNHNNNRNRRPNHRDDDRSDTQSDDKTENRSDNKASAETPTELDVVIPKADAPIADVKPAPKPRAAKKTAPKAQGEDGSETGPVAEDKPKRRRKAPARKKGDDSVVEVAE